MKQKTSRITMSPTKKRIKQLAEARKAKTEHLQTGKDTMNEIEKESKDAVLKTEPFPREIEQMFNIRFAYATFVAGLTYSQTEEFTDLLGWKAPSGYHFYHFQPLIMEKVEELLMDKLIIEQTIIINQRILTGEKFVPSFDGAYSHKRNAAECIMDMIHQTRKKIFALCIIEKRNAKRKDSDYADSSKSLEVTALKKLILDWKDFDLFDGYCHDLDSSARVLLEKMNLPLKEYFDHNHAVKHFDAIFNSVTRSYPKALDGIKGKLKTHFSVCVHSKLSLEQRREKWEGCFNYFISDKSQWKKKNNQKSQKALHVLIQKAETLFVHILNTSRTQLNESFHSAKCKFADKRLSLPTSWKARVQMAILEFNWPGEWKIELASRLGIVFPPAHREFLIKKYKTDSMCRINKNREKYIAKERKRRVINRKMTSAKDAKSKDYIFQNDPEKKELKDYDSAFVDKKREKLPATSPDKPLPENALWSPTLLEKNKVKTSVMERTEPYDYPCPDTIPLHYWQTLPLKDKTQYYDQGSNYFFKFHSYTEKKRPPDDEFVEDLFKYCDGLKFPIDFGIISLHDEFSGYTGNELEKIYFAARKQKAEETIKNVKAPKPIDKSSIIFWKKFIADKNIKFSKQQQQPRIIVEKDLSYPFEKFTEKQPEVGIDDETYQRELLLDEEDSRSSEEDDLKEEEQNSSETSEDSIWEEEDEEEEDDLFPVEYAED